mmetsp:Transcript_2381/g.4149  ORF Transcript_2381/g.4149 Transcript_2381/m.4149 type:complete len:279 (+) Transcript_2381:2-838(+)
MAAVFDSSPPGLAAGAAPSAAPAGAPGAREDTAAIKANIIQDVQGRLLQAKRETEQKVAAELKFLHNAMHEMDQRLDMLNQRLEDVQMPQSEMLEDAHVIQSLAKVEQQWGKELGKLKTELHQMIFAHNHNADLMKHQKDTLDKIRHDSLSRSPGSGATQISNARSMLASADARIKAIQANFQKMDPLVPRVTALELRLHHWHAANGGLSGPPAMGAPPMLGAYGFEPRPVPNPPDYEATVESPDDEEDEEEDQEEEDDTLGVLRGILGKAIDASSVG